MKTIRRIARVLGCQSKLQVSALILFMAVQEAAIAQQLSISDALVNESDGTVSLSISLSETFGSDVSVSWETVNVSASAGADFTGGAGTMNIPAGATAGTIQIAITDDDLPEIDEEFEVRLSNPVNATLADNSATVTIRWNDVIVANWDDGATNAGTVVYTHPATGATSPVFRITTRETTVGAWRTMLHLTAGEANLYLSRGAIPTTGSHQYKSERTGADGLVLASDEFAPGEVWYLRVEAQAGAAWSMVTGEVFVQNLGNLGYSDSNSDGTYDIGEPVIPLDSGTIAIGNECMRFFRVSVPSGTPAWSIWLNGDTREVAVRKNQVPLHNSTNRHDRKQSGHMLVVPTYLGSDQTTFFLSVTGNPGDTVRLDSRIQEVVDIAHNSTRPPETVTGVPYRVFRLQMPVDQLAWEVTVTPLTGNPNVALRRGDVPSEFVNDAFSEVPGTVKDSATVVPPTLVDGTWFITVYGTTPYEYSINNGVPVITPMDYVDTVVNDLTDKSGWRYYSVTDIASQLGSLGWELLLGAQVPGTEIAIRRNAVPGRWNYRTMGDGPSFSTQSMGHVDASSAIGWLQHPAHQADVWYVGIYTPDAALGPYELTAREITATTIAYGSSNTAVTDQPEGIWKFFRVDVPAGALGLDVWAKNVTSGDPQVVVRRDQLPDVVATRPNHPIDWVYNATSWPSGNSWTEWNDWSDYGDEPDGSNTSSRRLVASMGRPLQEGTYYIGVFNKAGSGTAGYTLLSRGIGADGSGCALEVEPLAFAGGSAAITDLEPRDGRFFKVSVPANARSWQVKVSQTEGELLLLACKDTVPDIRWSESADVINPSGVGSVGMSKSGDEIYHLLPKDGAEYLEAGDYFLTVVSQGVNPGQPPYPGRIGTGSSSGTIQSVGEIPVTHLGTASGTTTVHPDTLAAGEIKLYQINVPANTAVLEVVTDSRVGNPRVSVVAGQAAPEPNGLYWQQYNLDHYGWDYGHATGRFRNEEATTGNNPDVATVPSPPSGTYTIAVRANPIDNSDYQPDPASYDLKVTAVGIMNLAFNGQSVAVGGQLEGAWKFFRVDVPAGALGLDVWAKNVTSGDPQVVLRRGQLPDVVATRPNHPIAWVYNATSWPSGNSWTESNDWSGYGYEPDGSTPSSRRLVASMGRPLEEGTYYIGVYNKAGAGTAGYTLLSRGIGADSSGCALEAEPLAFAGGSVAITDLEPRDGRFFKVSVPANTRSWQVKVSQTEGELLLLACKDTVPDIRWSAWADVINPWGVGSVGMSKSGDEIYHLLPKDGAEYIEAGDYFLTVVSQGVNPGQPPYTNRIGTGPSSGTVQSVGEIPVTDLGTASGTTTVHPDTLAAGEIKLYQIQVPANTSVLEVVTDNRLGNPRVSVVQGMAAPQPNGRFYYGDSTDHYGWDYGRTTATCRNDEYATGSNPDVATVPSPPSGTYTIAVRANPIDSSDDEPDPASFDLKVTAVGIMNLAFTGQSVAVGGQLEGAWRFFRVDVPAGALGLDVWAKNVTSGDPQVVLRRDQLPDVVETLPNHPIDWVYNATSWPSGNSWIEWNDWSGYGYEPDGSTPSSRRLVASMGRPLEEGTYYIGVFNKAGSGTAGYTLLSRGIGADGSGCALEAEPLAFAGGSAAITDLEPRDGRFFKVSVPANTRSWQVKVSQTEGELLLLACKDTVPNIRWSLWADVINPWGVGSVGMSKSGDEIYHLLPRDGAEYIEAGDYFLTVVSQGVNPGQPPYPGRIGTGTSSGTIQSLGAIPVINLGSASHTPIVQPETLAGGEIKIYQINIPAGAPALEVAADNRVGNPRVSLVAGTSAPKPNAQYRSYPINDHYGWDSGHTTGLFMNPEYATGNNPDIATIPNPAPGIYTITVRANPIDDSDDEPDPANFNLKVRLKTVTPLNFDAALNAGGGSHTVTSQLFKQQIDYYSVSVPPTLPGQDITAWLLKFDHTLGDTRFQVSKSFTDWSQAITITGNTGVIAPPFLEPGTTCYVAVIGDQTAEYTITSSNLATVVPPWPMPLTGNIDFGDSGSGLPGDQGRDLAVGNWDFYAVDIPDGNRGLLRTVLEAINGDPDLYIREDGVPTLDHKSNGTNGTLLYYRSMTETTTQYGNWVPWNGRTEHQLRPGRWYLGVKAGGTSNARYRLRVSTGSVVDLPLGGASVTDQTLVGGDWRYYRFTMPEEAPLQWSVTFAQQQGDVVMHIRDTVPPGAMALAHESYEQSYLNTADDNKNQGPYVPEGYDLTGTHGFTVPWLRPGHTYYLGFHARNDATFSLTTTTAGSIGTIPSLDFYTGGIDATIPTGESLIYRIQVPPEATRIKWASTHPETVQLRMEQATLPETTGPSQHYLSSGAGSSLNQALASSSWPWIPGKTYYLRIVNNGSSEATVNLTMNGKNARTEDEDGNGLGDYWEQYWFGSTGWGARDDADGDSLSNFIEQAFNLDPTRCDLRTLAPGSGTSGLPLITVTGNATTAHLRVEYIRRRNAGLTYTVQFASGLSPVDWQPAAAAETVTPIDDDWERVVVEDSESVATMPLRFGRVVVTRQ